MDPATWHSIDSPVTRGWWQLRRGAEVLALVQPFEGAAQVNVYRSAEPWKARVGRAGSIKQGKRHAERWLRAMGVLDFAQK
jgi:hypothetical protein